jgi:signal transduction histidine kinase
VTDRRQVDLALKAEREQLLALSQIERDQRQFAVSLTQANVALSSSLNLNEVLDQILDQIERVIPFDAAVIALFDQEFVQIVRSRGFERRPAIIEKLQGGIPSEIYPLLKESGVWHSPGKKTDHRSRAGFSSVPGWKWVRAFISIPLQNGENGIGSLNLFYEQPQVFELEQIDRLTAFANQASIAIQNARLFRALETSLAQEHDLLARLIQSEKLAAMGRMIASVTHELNNPLQTIKNCLFLSRQDIPTDSPVQEYLEMAISETLRINDLVNQLREIYRPKPENSTEPYSLLKIINEVHGLLKPHLDNMNVSWQQRAEPNEVWVHCNADQIKQVFINIGMNGIEAMQPGGGTLEVSWSLKDEPRQVGVAFHDTGPGIPSEILNNLFEPFVTTKPSGLGLGLSICYELVQHHHGQITVDTQLDHGTTITVWLPV